MNSAREVLQFLRDGARRGERGVLVTIARVIGSSSRCEGTHMAVLEGGAWCGSLSGGCVEAAVVGEALRVLATGMPDGLRLGAGSPLIDIRLPCGGGLDLLIVPEPDLATIERACALIAARQGAALTLGLDGTVDAGPPSPGATSGWDGDRFVACHRPELRLVVCGHGEEVVSLVRLAAVQGVDCVVLTPDSVIAVQAEQAGAHAHVLAVAGPSPHMVSDAETAVVFLFHDHDWETGLMTQALAQDAFFIGAMGSPRTHAARQDQLRAHGASEDEIARVRGPVGLIPSTRDPRTLALSVLAEVTGAYHLAGKIISTTGQQAAPSPALVRG